VLARVDYARLETVLASRRLLTLIGSRVVETGGERVPDDFRASVGRAFSGARARGLALEWTTRGIAEALRGAGIRVLPLKGPLLAAEAYGDLGLRETADIDLLVASEHLDAAVRILMDAGYAAPPEPARGDGLPDLHYRLVHPSQPAVELHWRVAWYETAFARDMLARATPGDDGLLRPDPRDLATSLLLFYARDGFHGVRYAGDLAGWWDRRPATLEGAFLEHHAERYPALAPALSAAARAAEVVTGVPATAWLGRQGAGGRRVDLAARFADWAQQGDPDQLSANISLVGGLLGPRGSAWSFARRELLPYELEPGPRLAHAMKRCGRYVLALWRVRGDRTWAGAPS
jgi:hypothetical protein